MSAQNVAVATTLAIYGQVRHRAESSEAAHDAAMKLLQSCAALPNPVIAAAASFMVFIDAIDNEMPGFKALLIATLIEEARA